MNAWKDIEGLSKSDIKDLQDKKLSSYIREYLYPFSPYYRKLFDKNHINPKTIKTVEDIKDIAFTSKRDFINPENPQVFKEFILQPDKETIKKHWPAERLLKLKWDAMTRGDDFVKEGLGDEFRPIFITYTTGTTNTPTAFFYSRYDINNLSIYGARMVNLFEMGPSDYLLNMFPYAPHLAFWQVVYGGIAACVLVLSTGGGKVTGTVGNVKAILKLKPSVIIGVPTYVYHVLKTAKEENSKIDFVKKIVLGASRVPIIFKKRLEELVGSMGAKDVSIFGTYGFTEARCAWAECPTSNDVSSGYHLYPDKELFEIVDPETGKVKGEGEDGEIVYTSLDARGSIVFRYRTGDFVKGGITYEPCPYCHRTVPRLSSEITRLTNVKDLKISKIKGSLVNMNHIVSVLSEIEEVEEWQLEIRKKDDDPMEVDQMFLYVNTRNGAPQMDIFDRINKKMYLATELTPNQIYFVSYEEIVKRLELETAGKEKRILDLRPVD